MITFYKVEEEYGFLSNFYKASFHLENRLWPTVEHYFQSHKFWELEARDKILKMDSPMDAAVFGRRNTFYKLRADWDFIKVDVMYQGVFAKFSQNPELEGRLIETAGNEIVEKTKNDNFWGDGGDGSGKNMLGKVLMKVRDDILYARSNEMLPPWHYYPGNEIDSLFWRMGKGEDYIQDWHKWFQLQSREERDRYMKKYPLIKSWSKFYDEYEE